MEITEIYVASCGEGFYMSNINGEEVAQIAHPNICSQVDGEPWIQPAGDIVVLKSALKASSE